MIHYLSSALKAALEVGKKIIGFYELAFYWPFVPWSYTDSLLKILGDSLTHKGIAMMVASFHDYWSFLFFQMSFYCSK